MSLKYKLTAKVFESVKSKSSFYNVEVLFMQMWHSSNTNTGYSLTKFGLDCLVKELKLQHWTVNISLEKVSSAEIIMLSRYMKTPFFQHKFNRHTDNRKLVVFDENIAAQLVLFGGDIQLFLEAQDNVSNNPVKKNR